MHAHKPHPIPDSYWPLPGRLLAGEYPGAKNEAEARDKLRRLLQAGITCFLDLTQEGEYGLKAYQPLLEQEASLRGVDASHRRMPIEDMGTPSLEQMRAILDAIDQEIKAGGTVYVHCYGGIGRTGTVVGCYLVRRGRIGDEALAEIKRLRKGTPDGWKDSPETPEQREMVLNWEEQSLD